MTMPVQPSTVHVNDVDLTYVEEGHGAPVVFVHGSLADYRIWGAQLATFGERYRVVAYSRRFHWPNARPSDIVTYAIAQHVSDLGALIESLGLARAHVIGSSYGALTALTFAVERPDLVRTLVLGEPPLLPWLERLPDGPALLQAFLTTAFGPAGRAFEQGEAEAGVRQFLDGVLSAGAFDQLPSSAQAEMLDNVAEMRAETRTTPERYFPTLSAEDVGRLRPPTLLVQGEVSPPMFGRITDELARVLPDAARVTIPAASHIMHVENSPAFNEAVLAFLARH